MQGLKPEEFLDNYVAIEAAVALVYDSRADPNTVYEGSLSDVIGIEEWKATLKAHESFEARQRLKRFVRDPRQELLNMSSADRESVREDLLSRKLDDEVDRIIAETDRTFSGHLQSQNGEAQNPQNARDAAEYLQRARREWWLDQYARYPIEILDPRFDEVRNHFILEN